jgi:hypothetical protein
MSGAKNFATVLNMMPPVNERSFVLIVKRQYDAAVALCLSS